MLAYLSLDEINLSPLHLHIWGLFAALGFIWALKMALGRAYRAGISKYLIWDLMILALAAMIAGGRIFYLFSGPDGNAGGLTDLQGGFSLAGGLGAAGIVSLLYLWSKKQDILKIFDLITPGTIIALVFARIGCFVVNDHVGAITALPWALVYEDGTGRHPVALYEVIFLILMFFLVRSGERETRLKGASFGLFSLSYASFRIFADFLRCGDLPVCEARFAGLTASQWFFLGSIPVLIFLSFRERPDSRAETVLRR